MSKINSFRCVVASNQFGNSIKLRKNHFASVMNNVFYGRPARSFNFFKLTNNYIIN